MTRRELIARAREALDRAIIALLAAIAWQLEAGR